MEGEEAFRNLLKLGHQNICAKTFLGVSGTPGHGKIGSAHTINFFSSRMCGTFEAEALSGTGESEKSFQFRHNQANTSTFSCEKYRIFI